MAKIGIIMGSSSDWSVMEHAAQMLAQFTQGLPAGMGDFFK